MTLRAPARRGSLRNRLPSPELRPGSAGQVAFAAHEDPAEALKRHQITQRVDSADLVISGKITAVRLVDEEAAASASARAAAAEPESARAPPISEHAPLWQEAVVQVDSVLKGAHDGKTALVRFPASTDVRWYKAPKLSPGREGVFLHANEAERAAKGMLAAAGATAPAGGEPVFTALHPDDF